MSVIYISIETTATKTITVIMAFECDDHVATLKLGKICKTLHSLRMRHKTP